MSDFYQTRMGHNFFNNQLPALIRSINKVGDNLEKLNNDKKSKELSDDFVKAAHYKHLLLELIEYLCVAKKSKDVIEILYTHDFSKEDIEEFGFCKEDIEDVIEEIDNESEEE